MARRFGLKEEKAPYVIYSPIPCVSLPPVKIQDFPPEGLRVASIDVAVKNFALRIEDRFPDGRITPYYFNKIDFTTINKELSDSKGFSTVDPKVYLASIQYLEEMRDHFKECRVILIERQMAKNHISSMMFQHVLTFFLGMRKEFTFPDTIISDVSPKLKGWMLGVPKGLSYTELKKWGIGKAKELLTERDDTYSLDVLKFHQGKTATKADDLADTVIQMEAWFLYARRSAS